MIDRTKYRIWVRICDNAETVCGHEFDTDKEIMHELQRAPMAFVQAMVNEAVFKVDYGFSSYFSDWNGGRYSHQAEMYGWRKNLPNAVYRVMAWNSFCECDAEDECDGSCNGEWHDVPYAELPEPIRLTIEAGIETSFKLESEIEAKIRKQIEEDEAEFVAQLAVEEAGDA